MSRRLKGSLSIRVSSYLYLILRVVESVIVETTSDLETFMRQSSKGLQAHPLYLPAGAHASKSSFSSHNVYRCSISKTPTFRMFASTSNLQNEGRTTIDKNEVETFSQFMSDWWNPKGMLKGLHTFNEIRVPFFRNGMLECLSNESDTINNKKVLDVGCGGGILSEALAKTGVNVTGIDASKELIELAIKHSKLEPALTNNPSYYCTTMEEHANDYPNHYDGVIASEVIEHVNNKDLFIKSCVQALKPGGRIFFTTPSKTRISQVYLIWVAENIFNIPPKGTHQYEKFISYADLSSLLQQNNCNVESIHGLFYNVATNKWSWSESKSVIYGLKASKNYSG